MEKILSQEEIEANKINELSELLNEPLFGRLTSTALVLMARRIIALENSNRPKSKK